jgi:BON domain
VSIFLTFVQFEPAKVWQASLNKERSMNTKLLLASLCFFFFSCSPAFSDLSVQIQKEGAPAGIAANTPNSDMFVADQVRQALSSDKDVAKDFNNVKVESKAGVVTLTGSVSDEGIKASIGEKVANVPGVKSVDNKLEVKK